MSKPVRNGYPCPKAMHMAAFDACILDWYTLQPLTLIVSTSHGQSFEKPSVFRSRFARQMDKEPLAQASLTRVSLSA